MKTTSGIALVVLGLLAGVALTSGLGVLTVDAQVPAPAAVSKFQVSAYAGPAKDGFGHGCYILDSSTGELWHSNQGGKLEKVSDRVR